MHGHIHGVTAQVGNAYPTAAAAQTSAAQEAAATRRKLLRAAEEMGGSPDAGTSEMMGQWAGGGTPAEKPEAASGVVVCGTYRWSEGTVTRAAEPVTNEQGISYWV